jgi:hypothetical protein
MCYEHREQGSNLHLRGQSPPSCQLDDPGRVKRVTGLEPVLPAWGAGVLPLDDTRVNFTTAIQLSESRDLPGRGDAES